MPKRLDSLRRQIRSKTLERAGIGKVDGSAGRIRQLIDANSPDASVTVTLMAVGSIYIGPGSALGPPLRPRGISSRPCSVAGSYFAPTPFRSPVGE